MTEKKLAANRKNALKSTGPKTPEGKKRAALNALKHGLRAASPVVPSMEDPADWTAHRDRVVRDLAPGGYLETVLAERVATLLWRMGRVVRYESLSITTGIENVVKDYVGLHGCLLDFIHPEDAETEREAAQADLDLFAKLPTLKPTAKVEPRTAWSLVEAYVKTADVDSTEEDSEDAACAFSTSDLELSEIPAEEPPDEWGGWTAGYLRAVLDKVAEKAKADPADMRERVRLSLYGKASAANRKAEAVRKEMEQTQRARLIPNENTLEKVTRYETHLERALFRTLHELQRLQAARAGMAPPPPTAVDLDVSVHGEGS